MKLNSKLTGGLAWAGLVVVLAVPSADILMGGKDDAAARQATDSIRTATVDVAPQPKPVTSRPAAPATATTPVVTTPKTTVAATGDDPVDAYISSGKKLPSYISDAPDAVVADKPVTVPRLVVPGTTQTPKPAATEVAIVPTMDAGAVAPIPYPASMRPAEKTTVATASEAEAPLIIDEELVERREEAVARVLEDDRRIDGEELEEWDSGSLADYLERRGLISGGDGGGQADAGEFDEDGFFLDEGPNNSSGRRVVRRVRPNDFFFF
jgi:hypothetical protein